MRTPSDREAWIRLRREVKTPPDAPNPYNFGCRAAMGRLQATHPPIGWVFSALLRQIGPARAGNAGCCQQVYLSPWYIEVR